MPFALEFDPCVGQTGPDFELRRVVGSIWRHSPVTIHITNVDFKLNTRQRRPGTRDTLRSRCRNAPADPLLP